jgi:hypothetical protein
MKKFNYGNLLWFGTPPPTPEPKPYLLGFNPALSRFKPFGLPLKDLARASSADAQFVADIKAMMERVPPEIQDVVRKYGVAVIPVRDIFDVVLWLSWSGPQGYSDGRFSWETVSGLCQFGGHLLTISRNATRNGTYITCDNRQGVFNHELGHCLDYALGKFSESPEFLAAHAADVAELPDYHQRDHAYLLQEGLVGPLETFAECFASTHGACAIEYWTDKMPVRFSRCYQLVKSLVDNLSAPSSNRE